MEPSTGVPVITTALCPLNHPKTRLTRTTTSGAESRPNGRGSVTTLRQLLSFTGVASPSGGTVGYSLLDLISTPVLATAETTQKTSSELSVSFMTIFVAV